MAKVIAVFNQSGGVGKSTLTMNLGYHLSQLQAQSGDWNRVLLLDADPQASLTAFMGLEPDDLERTLYESLMKAAPLPIHSRLNGVDLAPANINLSGAELELVVAEMREVRLKDAIAPVIEQYDFILIDCPPSLGILSYISLVAATHVLIPIQTQYKSLKGTDLLLRTLARIKQRPNRDLVIAGIIPTLHDSRTEQGKSSLQAIEVQLASIGQVFPVIPRAVALADASQHHVPLALFNPKHPVVDILREIAAGVNNL